MLPIKLLFQKYHPELGDNLKVDDLSGRLLPEAAAAIKQHDPLDTARWRPRIAACCKTLSHNFLLRRCFLILQTFSESNIVERLLEKSTSMEKALEVCQARVVLCQDFLHGYIRNIRDIIQLCVKHRSEDLLLFPLLAAPVIFLNLQVSKGVIGKAVDKRKREAERSKGKNRSMAMIVPSILTL